jgi:hypothetical protein
MMHLLLLVALTFPLVVSAKRHGGNWCRPAVGCAKIAVESGESLEALVGALNTSTWPVERLDVSEVPVSKTFMAALSAVVRAGTLRELYMASCFVDDEDAVDLAAALADPKSQLAVIDIRDNSIGNAGAVAIAKALNNHTRELHLEKNPRVGMAGAVAFADLLDRVPNIAHHFSFGQFGNSVSVNDALLAKPPALASDELFYYDELYNKYATVCTGTALGPCQWPPCALLKHAGLLPILTRECTEVQARARAVGVTNETAGSAFLTFMRTDPAGILARAVRRHLESRPVDTFVMQRPAAVAPVQAALVLVPETPAAKAFEFSLPKESGPSAAKPAAESKPLSSAGSSWADLWASRSGDRG